MHHQQPIRPRKLSPEEAHRMSQRIEEETERAFREAPVRLFGLDDSWRGRRLVGGYGTGSRLVGLGSSRFEHVDLTLWHGNPLERDTPSVSVTVSNDEPSYDAGHVEDLAIRLWSALGKTPEHLSEDEKAHWWDDLYDGRVSLPPQDWLTAAIEVDGEAVDFRLLSIEGRWAAWARLSDFTLSLEAKNIAPDAVRLVRVAPMPYIEGLHQYRQERWGITRTS